PHAAKSAADVGDGNGTSHHERDVEGVDYLFAGPALFGCPDEVVGDAVVAAQYGRGHQAQEFLGFSAKRAWIVSLVVERKEALHAEMTATENLLVEVSAGVLEVVE